MLKPGDLVWGLLMTSKELRAVDKTEEISLVLRQVEPQGIVFERIAFAALFVENVKGSPRSAGMTGFSVGSSPSNDGPIVLRIRILKKYYKTNMKKSLAAS